VTATPLLRTCWFELLGDLYSGPMRVTRDVTFNRDHRWNRMTSEGGEEREKKKEGVPYSENSSDSKEFRLRLELIPVLTFCG
jgi:hypothetical protein